MTPPRRRNTCRNKPIKLISNYKVLPSGGWTALLDVVVGQGAAIFQLLAYQPLLIWRDSLLVLNLSLDVLDGIAGLHLKGDGLAREGLHENLHLSGLKTEI